MPGRYEGSWTTDPTRLSNQYFITLLSESWSRHTVASTGAEQYKADGKALYMLKTDLLIRFDSELGAIAEEFAGDNLEFLDAFGMAWTKVMNRDMFDGPTGNTCSTTVDTAISRSIARAVE